MLRATSERLTDLAVGTPELPGTGARLMRYLGAGGMSTVFLAEHGGGPLQILEQGTPRVFAVKFLQQSAERELRRANLEVDLLFRKEEASLRRVLARRPPCELVVQLYGAGSAEVETSSGTSRLPWLAIEYVDGGNAGGTLRERVTRAIDGMDPVRVARLVGRVVEGMRVLHQVKVIHRDLKPENVLVSGPVDDEIPKIADCGIARVEGNAAGTFNMAVLSLPYAGPEQGLPRMPQLAPHMQEGNPLIGPWSDVHALAAVVWYLVGGEPWCPSDDDPEWQLGGRRSLRTSTRLHRGFADAKLLGALDAVLARGAAHRLPEIAWQRGAAMRSALERLFPSLVRGPIERYATIDALAADLLPLLEDARDRWSREAARANAPVTAFRPTRMTPASEGPAARADERPPEGVDGPDVTEPGSVAFLPSGHALARFGDRLFYFVDGRAFPVTPETPGEVTDLPALVRATRHVVRGPGSGFALVGEGHVFLLRAGVVSTMQLPRLEGRAVGKIRAALGDGRTFAVVTDETDDSNGGPELWRSQDGVSWSEPVLLPIQGEVRSLSEGPFGMLVVASFKGRTGKAIFAGASPGAVKHFTSKMPPLKVALCGSTLDAWGAGRGAVVHFGALAATSEPGVAPEETPVAMELDLVGVPWLVTERSVYRRVVEGAEAQWNRLLQRKEDRPPLVAIGFTPGGAQVIDARGGFVRVEPHDIDHWHAPPS